MKTLLQRRLLSEHAWRRFQLHSHIFPHLNWLQAVLKSWLLMELVLRQWLPQVSCHFLCSISNVLSEFRHLDADWLELVLAQLPHFEVWEVVLLGKPLRIEEKTFWLRFLLKLPLPQSVLQLSIGENGVFHFCIISYIWYFEDSAPEGWHSGSSSGAAWYTVKCLVCESLVRVVMAVVFITELVLQLDPIFVHHNILILFLFNEFLLFFNWILLY